MEWFHQKIDGSEVRQWDQRINHKTTPIKSLRYRWIEISLGLIDFKLMSLISKSFLQKKIFILFSLHFTENKSDTKFRALFVELKIKP